MATTAKQIRTDRAELILDVEPGTRVQLHVPSGGNTVRVAGNQEALDSLAVDAGIPITNATGPVELTWSGELWAKAFGGVTPLVITAP